MNYLIVEGYQEAATKFAQESGLISNNSTADHNPIDGFDKIQPRKEIRSAIFQGNIELAIDKIIDLDPELLDKNPELHFHLLRLQLIEIIRTKFHSPNQQPVDKTTENNNLQIALHFAKTHLAKRALLDENFLKDFELTMALLCFPPDKLVPPLKELLDLNLRRKIAQDVNTAILESPNTSSKYGFGMNNFVSHGSVNVNQEAKLKSLVTLFSWGEDKLSKDGVKFPKLDINKLV